MTRILMFLKFGSEQNMLDLQRNGTIYMNSIQYFRKIEDGELRGDAYEGVSTIRNYLPGEFEIPEIGFKGHHLGMHLKESYQEVLGNIYSLYCISSRGWTSPSEFYIDKRVGEFGSHCLMIKDNVKFLKLIEDSLAQLNMTFKHGFIDYYDKKKENRQITLFEKPLEFEYQKEFRFYVERKSMEPFVFSIGNLENISELHLSDLVVDTMELKPKIK